MSRNARDSLDDETITSAPVSDDDSTASGSGAAAGRLGLKRPTHDRDTSSRLSTSSYGSSRRIGSLRGAGLSSLNLALSQESGPSSTPAPAGFNAISTLLNDPKRPQRAIDPSSSRYPALTQSHTELPKVKRSDYDATIESVKAEWARYKRSTALGAHGKARLAGQDDVEGRGGDSGARRRSSLASRDDEASSRAIGERRLPPLSTIPQVFFSEDFDMGNPYTFDLVTERYKAAASAAPNGEQNGSAMAGYDVALNQMLQEKMSYYSDVVEQHLILEISARSTSFFAALGNLRDLEAESRSCLDKVEELKLELGERDEGIAKTGLTVVREQAKRREISERLEAVSLLNLLCERRDLCQLLIQNSEWAEALDVMTHLAALVAGSERLEDTRGESSSLQPHVDLDFASIPAVQAMAPQLNDMRASIAAQLEEELFSVLAADLAKHSEKPQGTVDAQVIERSIQQAQNTDLGDVSTPATEQAPTLPERLEGSEAALAGRLDSYITGLVRTDGVDRMLPGFRDLLFNGLRKSMRAYLVESDVLEDSSWLGNLATLLEDDGAASGRADAKLGPGGVEAATQLRELPLPQFLQLLQAMLLGLTQAIKSADAQRRVVIKLLDEKGRQLQDKEQEREDLDVVMPPGVSPSLPTNMNTIVSDMCGLAHALASRLLSLRSSAHIALGLDDFLSVFHIAWAFVLESEKICGRMIIGLRGVVLNQAKAWLANFHRKRIETAAKAVEEEQWSPTEVTARDQTRVQLIVESATGDPETLLTQRGTEDKPGQSTEGDEKADTEDSSAKALSIDDKKYWIVPASLEVLHLLVDYIRVIINLPLLTTEVMGRVVEFLKQFNSRTCQVVLGAGAMRSAGLKNITARHLALASQSLSVMIALIPYAREAVRRHLNARQAVMLVEFDKLKRDYQEHQYEIHSKLVAIMGDRLTVHCRSMSNFDWSAPLQDDEKSEADSDSVPTPVKPIADLMRETTVLHKRLCTYLQPAVVEMIIGQVLLSTDERIGSELAKVQGHDDALKQRVSTIKKSLDVSYGELRHVTWSSKSIDAAVEEIEKREPPPPPPAPTPATPRVEEVKSPTMTPSYKPRLNIFGRRNQKGRTDSSDSSARPSLDVQVSKPSLDARPSTDAVSMNRPSTEAATPAMEPAAGVVPDTEPLPAPAVNAGTDDEEAKQQADSDEFPPPTPEKDHQGAQSARKQPSQQGASTPDATTSPPSTPSKMEATQSLDEAASRLKDQDSAKQEGSGALSPGESSPASTPTSAPPTSTATPVRMTLQQRLASAARKRAQASADSTRSRTQESSTVESTGEPASADSAVSGQSAADESRAVEQAEASASVDKEAEAADGKQLTAEPSAGNSEVEASTSNKLEDAAAPASPKSAVQGDESSVVPPIQTSAHQKQEVADSAQGEAPAALDTTAASGSVAAIEQEAAATIPAEDAEEEAERPSDKPSVDASEGEQGAATETPQASAPPEEEKLGSGEEVNEAGPKLDSPDTAPTPEAPEARANDAAESTESPSDGKDAQADEDNAEGGDEVEEAGETNEAASAPSEGKKSKSAAKRARQKAKKKAQAGAS